MLYSSTTAAAKIGCHPETVRRIAAKLKLGQELPSGLVFTANEIGQIKAAIKPVGCPKMTAGNTLWKRRKNRQKSGR